MNERDYRSDPSWNQSFLKKMMISPAHAKASIGKPPTDAMEFGSALHAYVLEPASFFDRYHVYDKLNGTTKEGKAQRADVERICATTGAKPLPKDDFTLISAMWDAIADNSLAAGYIFGGEGQNEKPLFWNCHFTGAPCKALLDRVIPGTAIVDLKKIGKTATLKAVWNQVFDFGYDFQGAFYQEGWRKLTGEVLPFILVFVEDEPPFGVRVVQLDPEMMPNALLKCIKALERALECQQSGQWPAYEQKIITIGERRPKDE